MTPEQTELFKMAFADMDQDEVMAQLEEWAEDDGCEAACPHGCWVESDGTCDHGQPSWLVVLGMV